MISVRLTSFFTCFAALTAFSTAAQEATPDTAAETDVVESIADADAAPEAAQETEELNPDEMADLLNSQQQLQQTFTLRRTINGEVVETEKRTVTYDRNTPYRETEAGETTVSRLKAAFDGEALTRNEAFEEAKLDFTIADVNRDGVMSIDEFSELAASWRESDARAAKAPNEEIARQREYDAFLAEISPEAAQMQYEAFAKEKFLFLTGGAETVTRQAYIREYLLDFDAMDADKDTVLKDEELLKFRALNRGETLEM